MDQIRVRGGQRLHGTLPISGAKNAALPLMAAALLSDRPVCLDHVPDLADIASMTSLLRQHGVRIDRDEAMPGLMTLNAGEIVSTTAPNVHTSFGGDNSVGVAVDDLKSAPTDLVSPTRWLHL